MKFNKTWTIRSKFKFLLLYFFFFFCLGIILYSIESIDNKNLINISLNELIMNIKDYKQNTILVHIAFFSLFTLLCYYYIGFILFGIYYAYEGISIGFFFASLINYKKIVGLYYSVVFFIINKFIYLLITIYILYILLNIFEGIIRNKFKIKSITNYLNRFITCIIIIFLNDIFLYNFGNIFIAYLIKIV